MHFLLIHCKICMQAQEPYSAHGPPSKQYCTDCRDNGWSDSTVGTSMVIMLSLRLIVCSAVQPFSTAAEMVAILLLSSIRLLRLWSCPYSGGTSYKMQVGEHLDNVINISLQLNRNIPWQRSWRDACTGTSSWRAFCGFVRSTRLSTAAQA